MSQFPPPQPTYQIPPSSKPTGMAVASMVLGIISMVLFCVWYVAIPCAIVAIILGAIAKSKANLGEAGGEGMAKTGLILGIISIILAVLIIVLFIAGITFFGPKIQQQMQQLQQQQLQQMQRQSQQSQQSPSGWPPPSQQTPQNPTLPTQPEAPAKPGQPNQRGNPLGQP